MPGVINLNAGTCSPVCRDALDLMLELTARQSADPTQFIFREAPVLAETLRGKLAGMLEADANCLLLLPNATYGINTVARALTLKPGDEVLMSDQEYLHYLPLWREIVASSGARLVQVPLPLNGEADATPQGVLARFRARVTAKTRVLFFSHVTSATGTELPAKALCSLARERGILSFVDGAHALGMVQVSMRAMRPDFYAANLHKWLMAPAGGAFLYVEAGQRSSVRPLILTGWGVFESSALDESIGSGWPTRWCYSHEYHGTRNSVPLLAATAALTFHQGMGGHIDIKKRTDVLASYAEERLKDLGLRLASPKTPGMSSCMTAFFAPELDQHPSWPTKAWTAMRERHRFEVHFPVLGDGRTVLRVSTAWFNHEGEIDELADLLARIRFADLAA